MIERLVDWGLPDPKRIVPCLIIYSDQNAPEAELRLEAVERVSGWADFFKIGLRLPERSEYLNFPPDLVLGFLRPV